MKLRKDYDELLGDYKDIIAKKTRKVLHDYGIVPTPTDLGCAYLAIDLIGEIAETGFFSNRVKEFEQAESEQTDCPWK